MGWEVFSTVELSERVEGRIHELARALTEVKVEGLGLMGGSAGVACFFAYYADWTGNLHFEQLAADMLEKAIGSAAGFFPGFPFSEGVAGLSWLLDHLIQENLLQADAGHVFDELDGPLAKAMQYEIEKGHYDYLHGAMGYALYFLRDPRRPTYRHYLERLVCALDDMAISDDEGVKWETLLDHQRGRYGINLGLAHGMPSVVILLLLLYEQDIEPVRCSRLIRGALKYIGSRRMHADKSISCFPSWAGDAGDESRHSRLAWCYGDPGIGLAFLNASKNFPEMAYDVKGLEVLLHSSLRRDLAGNNVQDAGICHGSSGLALIYNSLYQHTRLPAFREASLYWLDVCLNMAIHDDGIGGYKAYYHPRYGGWVRIPGLLEGAAGIGLTLLSFVHQRRPGWIRSLLLDL